MIADRALKALKTLKFFTLGWKIEQEQEQKNKIGVKILNTSSVFNAVEIKNKIGVEILNTSSVFNVIEIKK